MEKLNDLMRKELRILLNTLSDGLRQEVRQRRDLAHLLPQNCDISITGEREIGVASSLACHLRLTDFIVQVDSYVTGGDPKRRPDLGIWLPESKKYIYLELKLCAWGRKDQYRYDYTVSEIEKLNDDQELGKHPHGLVSIGFSRTSEEIQGKLWEGINKLSQDITKYPYEKIGLDCVDFQGMDDRSSYAVLGLWFRKEWEDN